ncbi:MAG: Rossmann-like domain-containing protein [Promethearchaeota archaeon]
MTTTTEFMDISKQVSDKIKIPSISDVFIPHAKGNRTIKKASNFGAIFLEDGSVGVMYLNLEKSIKKTLERLNLNELRGENPITLSQKFTSEDMAEKALGLGAINAISQYIFKKSKFKLDYTSDSVGLLNLNSRDVVGMVGFFPPLVTEIVQMGLRLIVVEKKKEFVSKSARWEVTLNPELLSKCTKVLITSTTIINDTIDDIMENCFQAEHISVIGPTGGFFPDPLFKRGVDVVGGTQVVDHFRFKELMRQNRRWGSSTKKYCITKNNYPGFKSILESAQKKQIF